MQPGDQITCRQPSGYCLTEGKTYEVVEFEPPFPTDRFTWPAYVVVRDDSGKLAHMHAQRFNEFKN